MRIIIAAEGCLTVLSPALNRVPSRLRTIHLIGVCGTGMASLAGMLKTRGYRVTGSDQQAYPPMSALLADLGIPVFQGYSAAHLSPPPDLVVVGNVITRENPEAMALAEKHIPYVSLPQALRHFAFQGKKNLVICGTHGKTTTASILAWILETAGLSPGFMIGGIPLNFGQNFKTSETEYFVIEGDEYDTAFFDKGPKFLHYQPFGVILTSIEFDHADIYRDIEHVTASFRKLVHGLPAGGCLVANLDDPVVSREAQAAACPVITYALEAEAKWRAGGVVVEPEFTHLQLRKGDQEPLAARTPLFGRHNLSNLLGAVALADALGVPHESILEALRTFRGVRRRQQILGEVHEILLMDDFAHHPSAVRETLAAVRCKYPAHRLIAVFEPRSNSSRRNVFQRQYIGAFQQADRVLVPEPRRLEKIPPAERFSSRQLARDLNDRGIEARAYAEPRSLLEDLLRMVRPGDLVLFMSNGPFDGLPQKAMAALKARPPSPPPL